MEPTLFYAHLVPLNEVLSYLDQYSVSDAERQKLEDMIYATIHTRVLETILSNTPKDTHESIIATVAKNPHQQDTLILIKTINPQIEEHILRVGSELKDELFALLYKLP